ncbi:hypothetical protein NPIL_287871, partial [Nephila pilipes]
SLPRIFCVETRNCSCEQPLPMPIQLILGSIFHPSLGQHYLRNHVSPDDTVRSLLFRLINSNISIEEIHKT